MKKNTNQKLLTHTLKQYETVALAVYLLGGGTRSVDTEDVAKKCHEIAPAWFSWQKYKDQINLELVRVSLSDAKKSKNGSLLTGSGREGWRLTPKGLDWLAANRNAQVNMLRERMRRTRSKAGSIDAVRKARERDRLTRSEAWREWKEGGALTTRQARQLFRIDEYTTQKMFEIKIARLRAIFEDDVPVSRFLDEAGQMLLKGDRNA